MTINRIIDGKPGTIRIKARIGGRNLTAILDSGSAITFISSRWVKKHQVKWREKERPYTVQLADDHAPAYGKGWILLETRKAEVDIIGIKERLSFDILDLGRTDMLLGMDWLTRHNPDVDWKERTVRPRSPTNASEQVKICRISTSAMAKHIRKEPSEVGAIYIRQIDKSGSEERNPLTESGEGSLPTEVQKKLH